MNTCGTGAWSSSFAFTTTALPGDCGLGTVPTGHYFDDYESGDTTAWTDTVP